MTHPFPMLSGGQQVLPTQEQFAEWDSEYFDGERQNFDIMMIKAFQAGADKQLEQVITFMEEHELLFGGFVNISSLKKAMRPQQQEQS